MFINKALIIKTFALGGLAVSLIHCMVGYAMWGSEMAIATSLPIALLSGIVVILALLLEKKLLRYMLSYQSSEGKHYYIKIMDDGRTTLTDDTEIATIFNSKKAAAEVAEKVELVPKENLFLVTVVHFED
jgi:hypothetical protein